MNNTKEIFIIAGPNGAGKTTFTMDLIDEGFVTHYLNADEIGGHDIPAKDIERRFLKSIHNFYHQYSTLADYSQCLYNENEQPVIVFEAFNGEISVSDEHYYQVFSELVENEKNKTV